jgi:hypothetical protein
VSERRRRQGPERMHAVPDPVPTFPTVDGLAEQLAESHPAIVLPRQLALARERAEWLGARLREQVAAEGLAGVVGEVLAVTRAGEPVATSEAVRGLYAAERDERQHVAALAERIARLGLDQGLSQRGVAGWISGSLTTLLAELGIDGAIGQPSPTRAGPAP